jgi:hypothetical protein
MDMLLNLQMILIVCNCVSEYSNQRANAKKREEKKKNKKKAIYIYAYICIYIYINIYIYICIHINIPFWLCINVNQMKWCTREKWSNMSIPILALISSKQDCTFATLIPSWCNLGSCLLEISWRFCSNSCRIFAMRASSSAEH